MSRHFVLAFGLLCSVGSVAAVAQPVRDNRISAGVGTAAITGVVLSDEREPRPLRRARVSLTGAELDVGHATVTADDGSFVFERLPPGRYSVTAAKEGYVTMSVGSQRPGRPGTGVEARAGEAARTALRLPKGAVITGMVLLPTGEPAPGVPVMPLVERYMPIAGERRLTSMPNTVLTDDRGVYRIYGLPPGTYVISAVPRFTPSVVPGSDIVVLSDAEIRRALSEVKEQTFASRPGMLSARPTPPSSPEPKRGGVSLAPIYYPGTPTEKQATPVTVAAGEVRGGIDIDLEYVRTAAVEGFVSAPAGTRVQLMLTNSDGTAANQAVRVSATPGDDGRFMFRTLPPGHYTIAARAIAAAARTDAFPAESIFWGNTEVIVSGEDITGVSIVLRPALTIAGRIAFRGATPPPLLPTLRLPIPAMAFGEGTTATSLPSVLVDGDRFRVTGALPGVYRFQTPPQGVRGPIGPWWLESVLINGKDLLDAELSLRESVEDAVITFSDRASELSGVVQYDNGQPFRDGLVVVFGDDRSSWFLNSRRVAAMQPSKDGRYVVRNLPPGSYFITVAIGLDRNEWFDPELLASLAATAQRVTLGPLEVKTHVVVLSR